MNKIMLCCISSTMYKIDDRESNYVWNIGTMYKIYIPSQDFVQTL